MSPPPLSLWKTENERWEFGYTDENFKRSMSMVFEGWHNACLQTPPVYM